MALEIGMRFLTGQLIGFGEDTTGSEGDSP